MADGIPADAAAFFAELEDHNDRDWWASNADRWRRSVRQPMEWLLDELAGEFGEAKLFRPHRDVRFSPDKSPYKNHQGAVVHTSPGVGLYVQVSSSGLMTGTGWWSPEPSQLAAYRAAVLDDLAGDALARIVAELESAGAEVDGDRLRTAPRGVDPGHPRIELLRHRTLLVAFHHGTPDWMDTPAVADRVRADWRSFAPLNGWLSAHLDGAS